MHRLVEDPEGRNEAVQLIDQVAAESLARPGQGPIDCPKCLTKLLLFGAHIASGSLEREFWAFVQQAAAVVPGRPCGWSLGELNQEVESYIDRVGVALSCG